MSTEPAIELFRSACTGESLNMIRRLGSPRSIPVAANADQRLLEAEFLRRWTEATGTRPAPSFMSAVHPRPDSLSICVSRPDELLRVLSLVLPWVADGRLVGMPGVRVHIWRDYLELRLLSVAGDVGARIRLLGVNRTRAEGRAFLARVAGPGRPVYLERGLLPGEAPFGRTWWSDRVLSDLLRRVLLWRAVEHLVIATGEPVYLRWRGAAEIAAVLRGPGCGIRYLAGAHWVPGGMHEIRFDPDEYLDHCGEEPWRAWEAVRAAHSAGRDRVAVAPCGVFVVEAETWEGEAMRHALAARDVSGIYKLLRRLGVSQRQIAAMTGQSRSEVSEILKGRQVMAYDVLVRIAHGLGVPLRYMGLAYDEVAPPDDVPAEVKRRRFLAHLQYDTGPDDYEPERGGGCADAVWEGRVANV